MPKEIQLIGNQRAQHDALTDWQPGTILYQAGVGGGKTWAFARKFLMLHALNGCKGFVTAPTFSDLWRLCVPEMEQALKEWGWEYSIHPNGKHTEQFPHMVVCGQVIYLISCEDPRRIAGFEVGHIWIDEASRIKQSKTEPMKDAMTQIRMRLRDSRAKILQILCSTTPEGLETWVQSDFFIDQKEGHRAYIGSTLKNKHLPAQYVQDLTNSLPPQLLEQYLNGIAVNLSTGLAHPTFTDDNISETAERQQLPVHIGMDFNVSPMAWVAGHQIGEQIHIFDELYIDDFALVDDAMVAIKAKGWLDGTVVYHPDKAAKQRSTTGDAEYTVITQLSNEWGINYSGDPYGANPPINNRINNLSRLICNGAGLRNFIVHPRCTHLISDLRNTERRGAGYYAGTDGKRGHILDGTGYFCWDIIRPQREAGVGRVYR